jgi:hypothetical protein
MPPDAADLAVAPDLALALRAVTELVQIPRGTETLAQQNRKAKRQPKHRPAIFPFANRSARFRKAAADPRVVNRGGFIDVDRDQEIGGDKEDIVATQRRSNKTPTHRRHQQP